jgi:hypothetical protein
MWSSTVPTELIGPPRCLPSSQVPSRSRTSVCGSETASDLHKHWCTILGLNQTASRGRIRHRLLLVPGTTPIVRPYNEFASRDAVAKLRLDGTPTPRSRVARMTKWPTPTGAGKSASNSGGPTFESPAMSDRNRACGSYGPGHLVHWIQAKKSHEEGQPVIKVTVVAVHDDGRIEIEGDDLRLTLWHHDPGQMRSATSKSTRHPSPGRARRSSRWVRRWHRPTRHRFRQHRRRPRRCTQTSDHHRRNLVGAQPGSRGRLRGQRGRLTVGRVGVAARGGRSEKCKGDTPLLKPTRPVILPGDEGGPILCRAPKAAEAIAELITMLIGRT